MTTCIAKTLLFYLLLGRAWVNLEVSNLQQALVVSTMTLFTLFSRSYPRFDLLAHATSEPRSATHMVEPTGGIVKLQDSGVTTAGRSASQWTRGDRSNTEKPFDFAISARTAHIRQTVNISGTDVPFQIVAAVEAPYGILSLGAPGGIQDMPFNQFVFVRYKSVSVHVVVNGTPFQQGRYIVGFVPLRSHALDPFTPDANTYRLLQYCDHVHLEPSTSQTLSLTVPFLAWRNNFNTLAAGETDELHGTFVIQCVRPISTGAESVDEATFTLAFTFEELQPSVPRPISAPPPVELFRRSRQARSPAFDLEGHGGNVSHEYHVTESAIGTINPETSAQGGSASIPVSVTPMDHVELHSGSAPVHMVGQPMSTVTNPHSVATMQLKAGGTSRGPPDNFGDWGGDESLVKLAATPTLYSFFRVFQNTPPGTLLFSMPLTPAPEIWTNGYSNPLSSPLCELVALKFLYFRGLPEVTMTAILPAGMSTVNIAITLSYGFPEPSISLEEASHSYTSTFNARDGSKTIKFDSTWIHGNEVAKVPHSNQARLGQNRNQDYSLGHFCVYLVNPLRFSTVCADFVDFQVDVAFKGKLFVPRGGNPVAAPDASLRLATIPAPVAIASEDECSVCEDLEAHGPEGEAIPASDETSEKSPAPAVVTMAPDEWSPPTSKQEPVSHFPFATASMIELNKRMRRVPDSMITRVTTDLYSTSASWQVANQYRLYIIPCLPALLDIPYASSYRGGLEFQFFFTQEFAAGTSFLSIFSPIEDFAPTTSENAILSGLTLLTMAGIPYQMSGIPNVPDHRLISDVDVEGSFIVGNSGSGVAVERTALMGQNTFRVVVPYQKMFNAIQTRASRANSDDRIPSSLGTLAIVEPLTPSPAVVNSANLVEVYVGAGDDARIGPMNHWPYTSPRPLDAVAGAQFDSWFPFGRRNPI